MNIDQCSPPRNDLLGPSVEPDPQSDAGSQRESGELQLADVSPSLDMLLDWMAPEDSQGEKPLWVFDFD